ncbi:hypothetical protein WJX73_010244 [Symbiochloris irregularis]|uniref:Uncharacterized protein n=1 Tax=Symbiochloris irregularis TaxID=706552 RepID=A0AAW1PJ56_9CHLO
MFDTSSSSNKRRFYSEDGCSCQEQTRTGGAMTPPHSCNSSVGDPFSSAKRQRQDEAGPAFDNVASSSGGVNRYPAPQHLPSVVFAQQPGWTVPALGQETSLTSFTDQTGSLPVTSDCHSQQSLQGSRGHSGVYPRQHAFSATLASALAPYKAQEGSMLF